MKGQETAGQGQFLDTFSQLKLFHYQKILIYKWKLAEHAASICGEENWIHYHDKFLGRM